ncbi:MAG TPA: excinuclease ABC subunit UvrC [Bdellovibrionales bacterium]|nr:excinuclease ABC subunit UvrC [Bdellovibrionales bacterium]
MANDEDDDLSGSSGDEKPLGQLSQLEIVREKIKIFPQTPGVYLMKNAAEKIIYVGKAKNLRARVRSYFTDSKDHSTKTRLLVRQIVKVDYILTGTEVEAFLVEASLIKKHRPRYNIRLKDDKSYPYIRVSVTDAFPRLYLARKVKKDGAMYFGPYTSGAAVWGTIRFLNQTFQIRDCKDAFFASRRRPCMTHEIGRCTAPCVKLVTEEDYKEDVGAAVAFLRGKNKTVIKDLTKKMKQAASEERFESAAKHRDDIESIKKILERQAVVNDTSEIDQDVIGYFGGEEGTLVETVHIRSGRVIGTRSHFLPLLDPSAPEEDVREWLTSFINQYYEEEFIPDELLLPIDLGQDLMKLLEAVLQERGGHKVHVRFPTDQNGHRLLMMANENATSHFADYVNKTEAKKKGLDEIQTRLDLPTPPIRIECFDISNFQGAETVASQVVFEDGAPNKDQYRRYKIRTVQGNNDFESMREVLSRRFAHTEYDDPQLVVIDGGKGQLGIAVEVLREIGRSDIPVVGLAKSRAQGKFSDQEVSATEERFFLPGRQNPVTFKPGSEAFQILVGIRDEAHRFAITYHRKLREATSLESELDFVVGLGEKRKRALLSKFSNLDEIKAASVEQISSIPSFNRVLAERILLQLNEESQLSGEEGRQPEDEVQVAPEE